MKRLLLALILLGGAACTPEETFFWDDYYGKPYGTTMIELCDSDVPEIQKLCPYSNWFKTPRLPE